MDIGLIIAHFPTSSSGIFAWKTIITSYLWGDTPESAKSISFRIVSLFQYIQDITGEHASALNIFSRISFFISAENKKFPVMNLHRQLQSYSK